MNKEESNWIVTYDGLLVGVFDGEERAKMEVLLTIDILGIEKPHRFKIIEFKYRDFNKNMFFLRAYEMTGEESKWLKKNL